MNRPIPKANRMEAMRHSPALVMTLIAFSSFHPICSFADGEQVPTDARAEQEKATTNLSQELTKARAVPNFVNGQPAGYVTVPAEQGHTEQKLGLRNGDVIQSVDGQPVNQPAKGFQRLGTMNARSLQIVRDGKSETVPVEGSQSASDDRAPANQEQSQ